MCVLREKGIEALRDSLTPAEAGRGAGVLPEGQHDRPSVVSGTTPSGGKAAPNLLEIDDDLQVVLGHLDLAFDLLVAG